MAALIGLFILGLLIAGLVSRKRRSKAWLKEERYEESGNWIDKRSGERGTWGSLDEEMAQGRGHLVRQGRAVEVAELIRAYAVMQHPGFSRLEEEQRQKFRAATLAQSKRIVANIEQFIQGKVPRLPDAGEAKNGVLKKLVLDFAYRHYPALLDLEIDTIRQFDALTGRWAEETDAAINALNQ